MDNIKFKTGTAQRVYDDYLRRSRKCIRILSPEDQDDILKEINSHIYESMQNSPEKNSETDSLLDVLERLGTPEEYLEPIVADRKVAQAARTFNPKHIFQALTLNLTKGVIYSVIGFLYFLMYMFLSLLVFKIILPSGTGLFLKNGKFNSFGYYGSDTHGMTEVFGYWLIPFILFVASILYILITKLLKLAHRKK